MFEPDDLTKVHKKGNQDELTVSLNSHFGGLAWKFRNNAGDSLSVICHGGSYGVDDGLFEIMASWNRDGDVVGHLTFGQVQRYISVLKRRANK
jgi:hypothetical protein